jgi:hypothetical protein
MLRDREAIVSKHEGGLTDTSRGQKRVKRISAWLASGRDLSTTLSLEFCFADVAFHLFVNAGQA